MGLLSIRMERLCMKVVLFNLFLMGLTFAYCFESAGEYYNIPPRLLWAIAKVESGFRWNALNRNKNGTYDLGLMQINSRWFPVLKRYGLYDERFIWEPCYNTFVGAWVLRQCIGRYGYNWRAVDCYNKGSKAKDTSVYVWKVYRSLSW
jgi:soluble lytic murein transglycosylase-like protein